MGKPVWAKRYTMLNTASAYLQAGQTDMHLTDDGGILVTGIVQHGPVGAQADLWAMKVLAKDGHIVFTDGQATLTPIDVPPDNAVIALSCSLTASPWNVLVMEEPTVTIHPAETVAVPWTATAAMQTP